MTSSYNATELESMAKDCPIRVRVRVRVRVRDHGERLSRHADVRM